jgi:hypothetical protein
VHEQSQTAGTSWGLGAGMLDPTSQAGLCVLQAGLIRQTVPMLVCTRQLRASFEIYARMLLLNTIGSLSSRKTACAHARGSLLLHTTTCALRVIHTQAIPKKTSRSELALPGHVNTPRAQYTSTAVADGLLTGKSEQFQRGSNVIAAESTLSLASMETPQQNELEAPSTQCKQTVL